MFSHRCRALDPSLCLALGWAALLCAGLPPAAPAQLMTFDDLEGGPWGELYGHEPGVLIFSTAGVDVYAHQFWAGETPLWGSAQFMETPGGFGTNQVLALGNVCLQFDFQGLRFQPVTVSLKFADVGPYGNHENVRINDWTLYWADLADLDGTFIDMDVLVTVVPDPAGPGDAGTVIFQGVIWELWIGGQEFYIDDLDAVPEPSPPLESTWGSIKSLYATPPAAHSSIPEGRRD